MGTPKVLHVAAKAVGEDDVNEEESTEKDDEREEEDFDAEQEEKEDEVSTSEEDKAEEESSSADVRQESAEAKVEQYPSEKFAARSRRDAASSGSFEKADQRVQN